MDTKLDELNAMVTSAIVVAERETDPHTQHLLWNVVGYLEWAISSHPDADSTEVTIASRGKCQAFQKASAAASRFMFRS